LLSGSSKSQRCVLISHWMQSQHITLAVSGLMLATAAWKTASA
jgi:hypothetical protein